MLRPQMHCMYSMVYTKVSNLICTYITGTSGHQTLALIAYNVATYIELCYNGLLVTRCHLQCDAHSSLYAVMLA